jgi:hypothetical protein
MSVEGMSVAVSLMGSVLLFVGAGRGNRPSKDIWLGRWHRWFTVGGLALLSIGIWIRIASLSPAVGACPLSSDTANPVSMAAHCFHGAPWPPRGSSR